MWNENHSANVRLLRNTLLRPSITAMVCGCFATDHLIAQTNSGRLEMTVAEDKHGWFLVRAIADNPKTFRFASTAPFYVEIGERPRLISRESAQFFLDWVRERIGRIKLDNLAQREEVVAHHRAAEKFWQEKVASANAREQG